MSLSTSIPPFSSLPLLFTQQLITQIQTQVNTQQELQSILTSFIPTFPPCKSLPIIKEQFFKDLIKKQPIQQALVNLYSFMTGENYSIEQKLHVTNVIYRLLYLISQIGMSKEKWKYIMKEQVDRLSIRFSTQSKTNNQDCNHYPILTIYETETLRNHINKQILPFYQLWEKLLDQNQYFVIQSHLYEPVKLQQKLPSLSQGKKLQLNEILSLDILKEYLSDKPPVEEKKDPKKK